MNSATITVAVEGDLDVSVVQRILNSVGLQMGPVHGLRGKAWLDQQIAGYNNAARYAPWLVLRDLDWDAACAPELVARLLPKPSTGLCLRTALRATEAWLLSDRERAGHFLAVSRYLIPTNPEALADPKQALVQLARSSRARSVREDIVPAPGTSAKVGPGYSARLAEYAGTVWRPAVAAQQSPSLARCLDALRRLGRQ